METVHYITNINLCTAKDLENSNISASKDMLWISLRSKRFCSSLVPKMEPEQKKLFQCPWIDFSRNTPYTG